MKDKEKTGTVKEISRKLNFFLYKRFVFYYNVSISGIKNEKEKKDDNHF